MKPEERLEKLEKLLTRLRGAWIFVEGVRDRRALEQLGLENILTISGNLRISCAQLAGRAEKVYVLTDLDRRGTQLALMARNELEAGSIKADLDMRKRLAHMLRIRFFEDAARAYERIKEEIEKER